MAQSIQSEISQLHDALAEYIEATYHISAPSLIKQRQELLSRPGVIHQVPYLESTPRYEAGGTYSSITGLDRAAVEAFELLAAEDVNGQRVIYDPPYKHQYQSIKQTLVDGINSVIMTGTGSGKTESFLLPILGKFAIEAKNTPRSFGQATAMRALILYPMNALVNDQLGRLRTLFGDRRLVQLFKKWCGRPARFARYTSRTPYAGVRTAQKDSARLKPFNDFYVEIERRSQDQSDPIRQANAVDLLTKLQQRGKWPAKESLSDWFGASGSPWASRRNGEFVRAVTRDNDSELLTRHEIQSNPPDLLVTNYSMLEYMLMRPIERNIFDQTRDWLHNNPNEKFLIVLDEAHLYRGAAGAEVGLLLRRLRDRLGIAEDRFQVICATASFSGEAYAKEFGSQLSGNPATNFMSVTGSLALREHSSVGNVSDVEVLSSIDIDKFHKCTEDSERIKIVQRLLDYRHVEGSTNVESLLHSALSDFAPMGRLINQTMKEAVPISELGHILFPDPCDRERAELALTTLLVLGSIARKEPNSPGLLPCRIHNFFRGLAGLWVCMDPDCSELRAELKDGICGRMYNQPHTECGCGARVLELFTCRNCGTAYARAYTDNIDTPTSLWSSPGQQIVMSSGDVGKLKAIDLLLQDPANQSHVEIADYDLETGRLNPQRSGSRMRSVYLRANRTLEADAEGEEDSSNDDNRGQFIPCGVCEEKAKYGKSYVQDHQTKGDEPFQALVTRQIQIQPPGMVPPTAFAPLQGRKVLAFSDSRQVAARLAPKLQTYSVRDSLRPLIAYGFRRLNENPRLQKTLSLNDLYFAALLGSNELNVRLRPELRLGETFDPDARVRIARQQGQLNDDEELYDLCRDIREENPPEALLDSIITAVSDRFYGFEALALASMKEKTKHIPVIHSLQNIPSIADNDSEKVEIVRAWLRCWQRYGFWTNSMPNTWWLRPKAEGVSVKGHRTGKFDLMKNVIVDKRLLKQFNDNWLPRLMVTFAETVDGALYRLKGSEVSLIFEGQWVHCSSCKSVHRPVSNVARCLDCGRNTTRPLDPDSDPVFIARKGFYRKPVKEALAEPPRQPMALICAEHTAQLNSAQNEDVFSKAEENELLFQDIELISDNPRHTSSAIDVLSSTTTMEVGIDLGALSGVALRNMPPGRANYQQRAGRAGRRGNAVATVIAFGSADSHDEHYFSNPDGMIRGSVIDPKLTLNNKDIVERHIRAFLLQAYHQSRLPGLDPTQNQDLFSVLGTVSGFRQEGSILNIHDFSRWLDENQLWLRDRISSWIPKELNNVDRDALLNNFVADVVESVKDAIKPSENEPLAAPSNEIDASENDELDEDENPPEEGEDRPPQIGAPEKLLDRLLYCGKLPRYAFPTDVATFHVFDREGSTRFRPKMRFAPSQGLPIALSQYAPGKQVWIAGRCYTSGAIYSTMSSDRFQAWQDKKIYMECSVCGFAKTYVTTEKNRNESTDCEACGGQNTYGPARYWLRPPGFAHPVSIPEVTTPDDIAETSYATRAKLTMGTPKEEEGWVQINDRIRGLSSRQHLLVSNTGPNNEGYSYCTHCGLIESNTTPNPQLHMAHRKPYPEDDHNAVCDGGATTRHLVLGTDFITDISLFSMRVVAPLKLRPGKFPTSVALRTVSEAIAKAGCNLLEIETGEMMAEYRPALTPGGSSGLEAEIFLYDTLPGGAGFASQLANRGEELFVSALTLMKSCAEDCDSSCYRCLRSFKNKFEHSLLDRHVGIELLEFLLNGQPPQFNERRISNSAELLFHDLNRQEIRDVDFHHNVDVVSNSYAMQAPILANFSSGRRAIICLSGALTDELPTDPVIADYRNSGGELLVVVVNELLVRGNLPAATKSVIEKLSL